jgi:hypothetical protein
MLLKRHGSRPGADRLEPLGAAEKVAFTVRPPGGQDKGGRPPSGRLPELLAGTGPGLLRLLEPRSLLDRLLNELLERGEVDLVQAL